MTPTGLGADVLPWDMSLWACVGWGRSGLAEVRGCWSGPGRGIDEVEAAGAVEGLFGGAGESAVGEDRIFVGVAAGEIDRDSPTGVHESWEGATSSESRPPRSCFTQFARLCCRSLRSTTNRTSPWCRRLGVSASISAEALHSPAGRIGPSVGAVTDPGALHELSRGVRFPRDECGRDALGASNDAPGRGSSAACLRVARESRR